MKIIRAFTAKPVAVAVLATLASSASMAASEDVEGRIAELERQLAELKTMMASNTVAIENNAEEIEVVRPIRKGTEFKYGGYVQLDSITTDYQEGDPGNPLINDFLVPSLIPVEPQEGNADNFVETNIHAKSSRFYFTTSTPTDVGTVSSRIELDFMLSRNGDERISNSWNSRIRHAYVKWQYNEDSSLLAGQTWSTFFNVAALPDLLDFVGPVGTIFDRQPLVRWTTGPWQFSVENPATRLNRVVDGLPQIRLDDAEDLPDIVARYNGKVGDLSWSFAAIGRDLGYEDRSESNSFKMDSDEKFGYGLSLAGKWMLGRNDLRFMASYGSALGRYMGLNSYNDGYIADDGDIETIDQWGAFIAYQHYWAPKWRSTFSLSASGADNPDMNDFMDADSLNKSYQSFHANLNYFPAPRLQIGGEVAYAYRELEDGREGDLYRVQFAVKHAF
ncbi:MAG: DcaP family trimeric outer membrane transporter [Halieaceae bacterium]|jgi:hypothetical protein|nr:DcaP family trimeric outer membrane transporter [Halieaceae bacterium]